MRLTLAPSTKIPASPPTLTIVLFMTNVSGVDITNGRNVLLNVLFATMVLDPPASAIRHKA